MEKAQNRIKRYMLIVGVVAIWGIIVYKVIEFLQPDNPADSALSYPGKQAQQRDSLPKDYTLRLDYADPFLKESSDHAQAVEIATVAPQPIKPQWPNLRYNGYIKHEEKVSAVLEINGSYKIVGTGDEINDIKVLHIYEDSISLSYKNESKTFKR